MVPGLIQLVVEGINQQKNIRIDNKRLNYVYKQKVGITSQSFEYIANPNSSINSYIINISNQPDLLKQICILLPNRDLLDKIDFIIDNIVIQSINPLWYLKHSNSTSNSIDNSTNNSFYIIPFWFSKNLGASLPIYLMRNHEIKINIVFKENPVVEDVLMKIDYMYIDDDVARMFKYKQDEYLIEQIDYFNTQKITDECINMYIEKPLKQFSWVIRGDNNISSKLIRDVKFELNSKEEIIHWKIKPIELQTIHYSNLLNIGKYSLNIELDDANLKEHNLVIDIFGINYNLLRFDD